MSTHPEDYGKTVEFLAKIDVEIVGEYLVKVSVQRSEFGWC
jgi:hypothetical protein